MTDPSTLSVDEVIALAVEWLQEGRATDAGTVCRRVLEQMPGHPDALHYSGVSAYQLGLVNEAIALVRQSLERAPNQSDWHSNLGIMLVAQDALEGAIVAFRKAIELRPAHAQASNNLGVLLRVLGQYEEAEAAYRAAIDADPGYADAYHNLAVLLDLMDRPAEAAIAHLKGLTLQPGNPMHGGIWRSPTACMAIAQKRLTSAGTGWRSARAIRRRPTPWPLVQGPACRLAPPMLTSSTCSTTLPKASRPSSRGCNIARPC